MRSAMPKSVVRCSTKTPVSWKVPGSRRSSTRSLAVSRPSAWSLAIRSSPPPRSTACLRLRSSSMGEEGLRAVSSGSEANWKVDESYRKGSPGAIRRVYNDRSHVQSKIRRSPLTTRRSRREPRERRLSHLNWMEMGEQVPRRIHTLLLPVGTLEAHGITSLGTDNEIPFRLSEALAERLNAIVAPAIPYGVTAHLGALAGGTHVLASAFADYVAAVMT